MITKNLLHDIAVSVESYDLMFDIGTVEKVNEYTVDVEMSNKKIRHTDCYVIGKSLPDLKQVGIVCYVGNAKIPCFISEKFVTDVPTTAGNNKYSNEDIVVSNIPYSNADIPDTIIQLAQTVVNKYTLNLTGFLVFWAIESNWGKSKLVRLANNCFGIQGSSGYNVIGSVVLRDAQLGDPRHFRKYKTLEDGFDAHGYLVSRGRYAGTDKFKDDPQGYINFIMDKGYAEIQTAYRNGRVTATVASILKKKGITQ